MTLAPGTWLMAPSGGLIPQGAGERFSDHSDNLDQAIRATDPESARRLSLAFTGDEDAGD